MFWLAAMLICSHVVERTVETEPNLAESSDSTVHTYPKKYRFQMFFTLDSGFKSFRNGRSDSPDACGQKAYLERKVYGFKSI